MKPTDIKLIKNIKDNNCNESYKELVFRHEKLYYKVCQKYSNVVNSGGASMEDLLGDKDFVFLKSIKSYKSNKKAKFSSWLGNHSRYHCLNFIKENCKYIKFDEPRDLDSFIESSNREDEIQNQRNLELKDQIFHILSKLKDSRIHEVFIERYADTEKKPTWANIAKKLNISTQTVINLHSRGSKILKHKMKSKKLLDFV